MTRIGTFAELKEIICKMMKTSEVPYQCKYIDASRQRDYNGVKYYSFCTLKNKIVNTNLCKNCKCN